MLLVCKRLDKRPFFHPSLTITYEEQTRALNLVSEKHNLTLIQKYIVLPKKIKTLSFMVKQLNNQSLGHF